MTRPPAPDLSAGDAQRGHFERAEALCREFPETCAGSGGMGGEGGPCGAHLITASEQGRCSGELCWYTLPMVDGLVVAHSKAGTLDVCEGGGRPPLQEDVNARRLAWFTDDELRAELNRREEVGDR